MGKMTIWYDQQGDFLEIGTGRHKGYFKDIGNDVRRLSQMRSEVKLPLEIAFHG